MPLAHAAGLRTLRTDTLALTDFPSVKNVFDGFWLKNFHSNILTCKFRACVRNIRYTRIDRSGDWGKRIVANRGSDLMQSGRLSSHRRWKPSLCLRFARRWRVSNCKTQTRNHSGLERFKIEPHCIDGMPSNCQHVPSDILRLLPAESSSRRQLIWLAKFAYSSVSLFTADDSESCATFWHRLFFFRRAGS